MFSVLILEANFTNILIIVFFLSGINLPIFLRLNPAIYRFGKAIKILFPSSKEKDESLPSPSPRPLPNPISLFIADFQNYTRLI